MFLLSQPSQSPHIILRYNVVDWYSATVNVVHLDQGAQGLPSGPQGLMDPSQHYTSYGLTNLQTYLKEVYNID